MNPNLPDTARMEPSVAHDKSRDPCADMTDEDIGRALRTIVSERSNVQLAEWMGKSSERYWTLIEAIREELEA